MKRSSSGDRSKKNPTNSRPGQGGRPAEIEDATAFLLRLPAALLAELHEAAAAETRKDADGEQTKVTTAAFIRGVLTDAMTKRRRAARTKPAAAPTPVKATPGAKGRSR
jgi:hypothetical protein